MKKLILILFILIFFIGPLSFISAEMPPSPPNDNNTTAPTSTPNPSPAPTPIQVNVILMRASNSPRVYEIKNGKRHWLPTAKIFNQHHFKWQDVQVVSKNQLVQYQRVSLLRAEGDKKVYYLTESGMIRHIPNETVFNSYGDKWEDIMTVSQEEIKSYEPNILIRALGDYKVYLLDNGKKRWIKTADIFNRLHYNWLKIAPVNQTELGSYPLGSNVE